MKVKHEADRFAFKMADGDFGCAAPTEERFTQSFFAGDDLIREMLIVGEFFNKR